MLAKLESLEKRYMELEEQLAAPDAYENQERYRKLAKAHADLREVVGNPRGHRRRRSRPVRGRSFPHVLPLC